MNGYIKFFRKTLDNPTIMKDAEHLAIWTYLLLEATHKECNKIFNGKEIILKPGQLITGRNVISQLLNINSSKTQRVLKEFETCNQIEQQMSNRNRLITIKKWQDYQINEQQMNNQRTTNEQQLNTLQEYKEYKECKNNIKESISKDIQKKTEKKYFESLKVNSIFNEFLELRKKLKAVNSERAINTLVNKLNNYDEETQYKMIENSIVNSWKGIFEIKEKTKRKDNVLDTLIGIYNE